jgi:ABC-type multidrug transport system ATPase subunit
VELGANPVLRGLDIVIGPGEIVAVVGVNGAGKSTLLRCLSGLQSATAGVVEVFQARPSGGARFWREVGMVGEQPAWYPGLTVREHLDLVRLTHQPIPGDWATVDELLERFGLATRADASPLTLSTGQRQRLALAAVFARPSRLLLLDEPEQGLDAQFRLRLADLLVDYASAGGTVVMATHDSALAAGCRARRLVLADGAAVAVESPTEP